MGLGENGRSRLDGDQFKERDRQIWRMRADGHTVRQVAAALGCGVGTVDRATKRLVASAAAHDDEFADLIDELGLGGAAVDAALSRYEEFALHAEHPDLCPSKRCSGPHVGCAADVEQLDDLQFFRLLGLPVDHSARVHLTALQATGWRRPGW